MYINFKSVSISGFKSISSAMLDLTNQGIVLVKGVNDWEENSKSNGSGKSSLFESIVWAIYGQTSNGISDPTNRYLDNGCYVKLVFSIDDTNYTILRSIKHKEYGTSLSVTRDGDDISGRNKTDTEKIIKQDIIPVNKDIFLSTIFLSQGFSNRISLLSPSGRKERIETLSGNSAQVEIFKDKVSDKKQEISDNISSVSNDISYERGKISTIDRQISDLNEIISKSESNNSTKYDVSIDDIKKIATKYSKSLEDHTANMSATKSRMSEVGSRIREISRRISILESEISSYTEKLSSLRSKKCPTCGQDITGIDLSSMRSEYKSKIASDRSELESIELEKKTLESELSDTINPTAERLDKLIAFARRKVSEAQNILIDMSSVRDTSEDRARVDKLKSELLDINSKISKLEDEYNSLSLDLKVANHCVQIVTKHFRGYLLKNVIDFMNSRLSSYSSMMFSNSQDVINLRVDAAKLDIYLGEAQYDTLSGGEARKVDIALVLAQRDLALNVAGITSNLLILDEVLDNLDETATNSVLGVIDIVASTVDSIFIISHNDYDISYDRIITVRKDGSRLSTISL